VYPRLRDAHERTGDLAGFAQILSQRADQVSEDVDARLWHARALLGLGRTDDGLAQLRRLIDQMPDLYPAYTEMGRALLACGRAEEAVKVVEELLSRIPSLAPRLRCSRCGSAEVTLHFRCPHCGEWDSIG
jgi:lipopolysaccharide biosynthesis regulator YciM